MLELLGGGLSMYLTVALDTDLLGGLQQVAATARVVLRVLPGEVLGQRARRELRLAHVAEVAR